MHRCYACDPANPDRIFTVTGDRITARVPGRFAGPPGSANGGIAAGMLACPSLTAAARDGIAHGAVTRISARIPASVPLGKELRIEAAAAGGAYGVSIIDGDQPLVTGSVEVARLRAPPVPGAQLGDVPAERVDDIKHLAMVVVPDRPPFFEETGDHPIRGCFSCGPDNGAGLHIYPRVVDDGVVCAPWRPAPEFDDGDGALATVVMTSALDCSSGICMPVSMQRDLLDLDQFFLLGSLDVRYLRVPPVDRDYRVAAKARLRDGRKFFGISALFDGAGTPYAMVESTWIVAGITRTQAFGARA